MPSMEVLVEQHGKDIYGLCRRLTTSRFDADDLYQQTFLTAMSKQFRDDGNCKALLVSICIAQWKNEVRKHSRRNRIAPEKPLEEQQIFAAAEPETLLQEKQQKAALRAVVAKLDDRCRIPVLLYYGMEMPLSEIAGVLHIPVGTVKSRLSAAREKIKKELEVTGYDR